MSATDRFNKIIFTNESGELTTCKHCEKYIASCRDSCKPMEWTEDNRRKIPLEGIGYRNADKCCFNCSNHSEIKDNITWETVYKCDLFLLTVSSHTVCDFHNTTPMNLKED